MPSTTGRRFKHIKLNEDRVILKDGLFLQKYYGETGNMKSYEILITKQLVDQVLWSLRGQNGKHPGIAETISANRQKYYNPNMAQLIRKWVITCEQCIRESRVDEKLATSVLQSPTEHITAAEDAMKIYLAPELRPSSAYEKIVRTRDVFSRNLLASLIAAEMRERYQSQTEHDD